MSLIKRDPLKIALFVPSLRGGGVERVFLLLSRGLTDLGQQVDLVTAKLEGKYLDQVDPRVQVVDLAAQSVVRSFPGLLRYLRRAQPDALISAMPHANCTAVAAVWAAGVSTRLILSEHNPRLSALRSNPAFKERILVPLSRWLYPHADAIVGVSDGVARDISVVSGLPSERITRIYNPVWLDHIEQQSMQPLDHPWFAPSEPPVILAVGRLSPVKDFETLVRAFAEVRSTRLVRLVILGEGAERVRLEALAKELGVAQDLSMPGFVPNPYNYMRQCSVFVLSSKYEGFGMVLVEAMACGAPVIATDCPSGPGEILAGGQFGRLVPVGDPQCMSEAIIQALDNPVDRIQILMRANEFSLEKISLQYLNLIRGENL